jgi:hypothetical protein
MVDRVACGRKCGRRSVSHFDKGEAFAIKHDQIDFAATAMEVSRDGPQVLIY